MEDSCIVLEGGGLRGAFTGGVLDCLMERDFLFDHVIGVSAGACNGASYLSRQKGRNRIVDVDLPSDGRYMGLRHLVTGLSYFNMSFIFDEIPRRIVPFDEGAAYANPVRFEVGATSLESGRIVFFGKEQMKSIGVDRVLVASSSIPLLSRPVDIDGSLFLDGGVADSVPVRYALSKFRRVVVVLTRPRGYRKGRLALPGLVRFLFRDHPAFAEAMLRRNESYNEALDYCDEMEARGRLFILAPEFSIGRAERNHGRRLAMYEHGYDAMWNLFGPMGDFLAS